LQHGADYGANAALDFTISATNVGLAERVSSSDFRRETI
jgi:hypothetical protein